jgi:Ser/Thr protein kinase RdoA (MazF antagonist)
VVADFLGSMKKARRFRAFLFLSLQNSTFRAMIESILKYYNLPIHGFKTEVISNGLINSTWKIVTTDGDYILQQLNTKVFTEPLNVAGNIELLSQHARRFPTYTFVHPVSTINGETCFTLNGTDYYRMFPFIPGSSTINKVSSADEAYEASRQFGAFTTIFSGIDTAKLNVTIPGFHDLQWRHQQFVTATEIGNPSRIRQSDHLIKRLNAHTDIVATYLKILSDPHFKKRVTHHDTKISNVLFDQNKKGICVIDLDTVMPGYFISDVGDMMRTYLSPTTEEDDDFRQITVRRDVFEAIVQGYLEQMQGVLTAAEKTVFAYSGSFLTYMQALRFMADYLNNDVYYGSRYPGHNYTRAENQLVLLERLEEQRSDFDQIVKSFL